MSTKPTVKIKLGNRPKNFKKPVIIPLHEGELGKIVASYIYRTRTEFGDLVDEINAAAGVKLASASEEDVVFSLRKSLEETRDHNADYLMKILDGWDLDAEFSRKSMVQLCDELPGLAFELINDYRQAITEGRLGN